MSAPDPRDPAAGPGAGTPTERPLGRVTVKDGAEGAGAETGRTGPVSPPPTSGPLDPVPPLPLPERPASRPLLTLLRWVGGAVLLSVLAYLMWTPGEWTGKLFAWVLLTILADEFGGWFGYAGLVLGGLGYLGPNPVPEQWLIILPLVGGALGALLLVKHSGGPLVLPFAGALYAGTLWGVGKFAGELDAQMKLPGSEEFLRSAWLPMLIGLLLSFVRQVAVWVWSRQTRARAGAGAGAAASA